VAPILTYESGPTKLGEQLSLPDLGAALTAFERLAADTITAGGGQIVTVHERPPNVPNGASPDPAIAGTELCGQQRESMTLRPCRRVDVCPSRWRLRHCTSSRRIWTRP
jgi:hypothetical protein